MKNFIRVNCTNCQKEVSKPKHLYNYNIKHNRNFYCSNHCIGQYKKKQRPKFNCSNCNAEFELPSHSKTTKSGRRFCSQQCANIVLGQELVKIRYCKTCNTVLNPNRTLTKAKYCQTCRSNKNRSSTISSLTKEELFSSRSSWQSARTAIRHLASNIYKNSDKPQECVACGYKLHFEICHIKAVKDFDNSALISEINHIDNLIALCPTHHWEQENGYLNIDKLLVSVLPRFNEELPSEGYEPSQDARPLPPALDDV